MVKSVARYRSSRFESRMQRLPGCGLMDRMSEHPVDPDGVVHIPARGAEDGHWSASFDWSPEVTYGGETALVTAQRLVRAVEQLDESTLRVACRLRTAGRRG